MLKAFAGKTDVYRVVGLGHTQHTTLLDVVSDFAAKTPSLAGSHIREHIERYVYPLLALRSAQGRAMPPHTRSRSLALSLALLLAGVLLGLLGGVWLAR